MKEEWKNDCRVARQILEKETSQNEDMVVTFDFGEKSE